MSRWQSHYQVKIDTAMSIQIRIGPFSGYGATRLPPPRESDVTLSSSRATRDLSVIIVITRPGAETTWSSIWRHSVSPGDSKMVRLLLSWRKVSFSIRDRRGLWRENNCPAKWSRLGDPPSHSDPGRPLCHHSRHPTVLDPRHHHPHQASMVITTQRCSGISIEDFLMTMLWQTWFGDQNSEDSFPEIKSTPRHLIYSQQISCNSFFVAEKNIELVKVLVTILFYTFQVFNLRLLAKSCVAPAIFWSLSWLGLGVWNFISSSISFKIIITAWTLWPIQ